MLAEYDRYAGAWFGALMRCSRSRWRHRRPIADLGSYPRTSWPTPSPDHYCHLRIDLLGPDAPLRVDCRRRRTRRSAPASCGCWGMPQMQKDELATAVTQPLACAHRPRRRRLTVGWRRRRLITITDGIGRRTATVESSAHDFVSWGTKRCDWRPAAPSAATRPAPSSTC